MAPFSRTPSSALPPFSKLMYRMSFSQVSATRGRCESSRRGAVAAIKPAVGKHGDACNDNRRGKEDERSAGRMKRGQQDASGHGADDRADAANPKRPADTRRSGG